eukprot:9232614-Pyramimonas_sp.AAC.1
MYYRSHWKCQGHSCVLGNLPRENINRSCGVAAYTRCQISNSSRRRRSSSNRSSRKGSSSRSSSRSGGGGSSKK